MKMTQRNAILVVAILVVIACFFAVYLRLFTGKELWYEMFAAVLGVIITAVITMILLKGQSDDDVKRERDAKIFEEKLRIYQDYLHTLCDVIKDHSLSDEEKIRLEFQTSYVAMHCDSKYIATVSNAVKELIKYCCPDEENENLNRKKRATHLTHYWIIFSVLLKLSEKTCMVMVLNLITIINKIHWKISLMLIVMQKVMIVISNKNHNAYWLT